MRKRALSVLLLVTFATITANVASAQAGNPTEPPEPSPCITDAQMQLTANPAQVQFGQSTVMSWSVTLPSGCTVVVRFNGQVVGKTGSQTVTPTGTRNYNLTISRTIQGVFQQRSVSKRVEVRFPDRVVIDPTTPNPVQVLISALGANPITIELCDVELDLTGHSLEVGHGTSLIASPRCARGPRSLGSLIYITDNRPGSKPLFAIRGDNVVFSGFRLRGPTNGIGRGDNRLEKAIKIHPFSSPDPIHKIEISNMEIFYWSGIAVEVADNNEQAERGRLFNTNPGAVTIRDSFIHDNQHGSGNGYGVKVGDGGYATIEHNVFDKNRHAIAGGSLSADKKDASGYTLRENLILEQGGKHCPDQWFWGILGWPDFRCWQTHQVDMHGSLNAFYSNSNWCCGIAGETIIIERNTILYDAGPAIKIRGNPADKAVADQNVFKHGNRNDAIKQNGDAVGAITNPIDVLPNNVFLGKNDPVGPLGSCDFVGDGGQDQFLATGVTWWARSNSTAQWRYLNTKPERNSRLQLGHVDNDGKCDVALRPASPVIPPRFYAKNGMGAWRPVQVLDPIGDQ
ncbi:MAG TPA: hypothetical protein VFR78_20495 [Pyrinomonadaceae bacterium]|nr:hypothetical protein [Pyrinomonadaceae bacterium]